MVVKKPGKILYIWYQDDNIGWCLCLKTGTKNAFSKNTVPGFEEMAMRGIIWKTVDQRKKISKILAQQAIQNMLQTENIAGWYEKIDREFKFHLERPDADACIADIQFVSPWLDIDQLKKASTGRSVSDFNRYDFLRYANSF